MTDPQSLPNLADKGKRARWLASLPVAHHDQLEKILLKNVEELTSAVMPPHQRFISLEAFAEPVASLGNEIKRLLQFANFPTSAKFNKRVENFKELLNQMALAYLATLNSLAAHGYDGRESTHFTTCIFRAIQLNFNQQNLSYLCYRQPDTITWERINKLYQLAYAKRIHLESVPSGNVDLVKAENIEHLYKQIILLNLANPFQFSNLFTLKLTSTLGYWAQFCHMYNAETQPGHSGLFAIQLNLPQPPKLASQCDFSTGDIHIMDTSSLLLRFRQILTNPGMQLLPDSVKELINQHPFAYIRRIYNAWGKLSKRIYARRQSQSEIYITVGFRALYNLLLRKQERSTSVFHTKSIANADGSGIFPNEWALEEIIETDSIMHRQLGHRTQNLSPIPILTTDTASHSAQVVDESAGGYCVKLAATNSQHIQVGDLVCCHYNLTEQNRFTLCVVRWMKESESGFVSGIEVISPFAEATVVCESGKRDNVNAHTDALLLPQIVSLKLQATLLTAKSAILDTSKQHLLKTRSEKQIISLCKLVESTSTFNRFSFEMEMGIIKQPLI